MCGLPDRTSSNLHMCFTMPSQSKMTVTEENEDGIKMHTYLFVVRKELSCTCIHQQLGAEHGRLPKQHPLCL